MSPPMAVLLCVRFVLGPWRPTSADDLDARSARLADTQHITARIDRDTADRLTRRARSEDRSASSIVRLALRRYLGEREVHVHTPDRKVA